MPELTEDSPEVVLAAALLEAWLPSDTPDAAMRAFDEAWQKQRTPTATRTAKVPA